MRQVAPTELVKYEMHMFYKQAAPLALERSELASKIKPSALPGFFQREKLTCH